MSTPASLRQGQKALALFSEFDSREMQNLLGNGDLIKAMATADLSRVDRRAFHEVVRSKLKIEWTPVDKYKDKLREWNGRFRLGLAEEQIDSLVLPDHAGPHQPTGISLSLGTGLLNDRKVVQRVISYERWKIGQQYTDYIEKYDKSVAYFSGSEPKKSKGPRLGAALLDIGRFWNPWDGVSVDKVRQQLKGQPLPGLEVDWLMALNPRVLTAIDYEKTPGFIAAGLVVGSSFYASVFGRDPHLPLGTCVTECFTSSVWRSSSVVAFREC